MTSRDDRPKDEQAKDSRTAETAGAEAPGDETVFPRTAAEREVAGGDAADDDSAGDDTLYLRSDLPPTLAKLEAGPADETLMIGPAGDGDGDFTINLAAAPASAAADALAPVDEVLVTAESEVALGSEEPADRPSGPPELEFTERSVIEALDLVDHPDPGVSLRRLPDEEGLPEIETGRGKYQILRKLGQSPRGRVFLAYHRELRRLVALKLLRLESDRDRVRFLEEAQILAQLEHPHIVALHDLGVTAGGTPYCTSRYLRGRTLANVLQGLAEEDADAVNRYPLARRIEILMHVVQAVDYAHRRGVVHRSLSPSVVKLGDRDEVQVVAWELAKVLGHEDDGEAHVVSGATTGRSTTLPAYTAPEVAKGEPYDERADVFSLGTILYEILTIERAFSGHSVFDVLQAVVADEPAPPSKRAPERAVPPALEQVCIAALAKDPAKRVASASAFYDVLRGWLERNPDSVS